MSEPDFNLSDFLPYRLAVLSERVSRRVAVEYEKKHGLSVAEWRVLVHLQRAKQVSVRELHSLTNMEKSRVSRAVSRLEADGLVRKTQGSEDSRLVAITLSDKGTKVLSDILPGALEFETRLLESLGNEDLQTLMEIMGKMHRVLDHDPDARPMLPQDKPVMSAE
jgi:DNA-binding MarR family transcriptional regulator